MRTRTFFLAVILMAFALTLAACGEEQSGVVARPVVRLQVNDRTYEENVSATAGRTLPENTIRQHKGNGRRRNNRND